MHCSFFSHKVDLVTIRLEKPVRPNSFAVRPTAPKILSMTYHFLIDHTKKLIDHTELLIDHTEKLIDHTKKTD